MTKYEALIFDIDGAAILTRLDARPSNGVIDAVKKAQRIVKVSAATGRSMPHARRILSDLALTDPCIVSGGTQIIDPTTKETLWEKRLTPEQVQNVIDIFTTYPYGIGFSDEVKGTPAKDKKVTGSERIIYVWALKREAAEDFQRKLNQIEGVAAHIAGSWTKGRVDIHVTNALATKKNAIEKLIEILDIEKENIIGVGDSDNDLPLFESVGYRVAMGNAVDRLKNAADYIAPSVDEEGLVDVIDRFILK
jgi:hypothetical protein